MASIRSRKISKADEISRMMHRSHVQPPVPRQPASSLHAAKPNSHLRFGIAGKALRPASPLRGRLQSCARQGRGRPTSSADPLQSLQTVTGPPDKEYILKYFLIRAAK